MLERGLNLYSGTVQFSNSPILCHTCVETLSTRGQALGKTFDILCTLLNLIMKGNPNWHGDICRSIVKSIQV